MGTTRRIPEKRKVTFGYSFGEFGFTFFNFFIAYYLMLYLTDVLDLPLGLTGIIYTAIQWVEGILMFLSGIVIDRKRFRKWHYRPWIIGGTLVCAVSTVICFLGLNLGIAGTAILFTAAYTLIYAGFNIMWVSYRSLLDPLSETPNDTVLNSNSAAQMGSAAGIIFSFIGTRLLYAFPDIRKGYLLSAAVYSAIMVVCMLVVAHTVKPYDAVTEHAEEKPVTIRELLRSLNRDFFVLFLSVTFRESATMILNSLMIYYMTYAMGHSEWMSVYLLVNSITVMIGYSFSSRLIARFGKKRMYLASCALSCLMLALLNIIGVNEIPLMICLSIYSFCGIFSGALIPVFMNDLAVYNEANYGIRGHAFTSSVGGCALRMSQVIGGGMASFGLLLIGYEKGEAVTPEIAAGITRLMTWGCIAVIIAAMIVFCFYRLDGQLLEEAYSKEKENHGRDRKP